MKGAGRLIKVGRALICLALLAALSGCTTWIYTSPAIKARVVDSESGLPLDGVMVLATWDTITNSYKPGIYMDGGGPPPLCRKLANLSTAVSGKDGVFAVPAWGPRSGCFTMYGAQPTLVLYRPGYRVLRLLNVDTNFDPTEHPEYSSNDGGTVFIGSTSRWIGKTIPMTPVGPHSTDQYGNDNHILNLFKYQQLIDNQECFWNEVRPAILLILQEERRLKPYARPRKAYQAGIGSYEEGLVFELDPKYARLPSYMPVCGHPKDYIEDLVKEADHTRPDAVLPQYPKGSPLEAFEKTNQDPWALPTQVMPDADDLAPDGAARRAIIYHVNVYTDTPEFARLYITLPLDPDADWGGPWVKSGVFMDDRPCAAFSAPTPAGETPKYLYVPPHELVESDVVAEGYPTCYRVLQFAVQSMPALKRNVVGSLPSECMTGQPPVRRGPPGYEKRICDRLKERMEKRKQYPYEQRMRSYYDSAAGTLDITEAVLAQTMTPAGAVPEYIEIDGDPSLVVTSNLTATKHHWRWIIPPPGQLFDIHVVLPKAPNSAH